MRNASHWCRQVRAFTLVELLVVIGIIALLISILLPSLARARDAANSVACLSNLRQLGMAIQMYGNDNKGVIIPFRVNWTAQDTDNWVSLLCRDGLIGTMRPPTTWNGSDGDSGPFRCPAGADSNWAWNEAYGWSDPTPPGATLDVKYPGIGNRFWRFYDSNPSTPSRRGQRDTWYSINSAFFTCGPEATDAMWNGQSYWSRFPSHFLDLTNSSAETKLHKFVQIKDATRVPLLGDGYFAWGDNPQVMSARHSGNKAINFVFVDGHAETLSYKSFPATKPDFWSMNNLRANYNDAVWRLGQ